MDDGWHRHGKQEVGIEMVSFSVPTDTAISEIRNRVIKIIGEQLGIADDKIVDTANFSEDLNADSLEVVQIVMEIEEEFDIEIPDAAADSLSTVGDAIRFIQLATT
ncbi:Acyl carrier protein (ACP) (modular protein) [Agrobacterium deltaense Zutra 3/1]|uniref:Acyl carrier protein n=1 Tax=Agrobacterium deltaense Zutra 3/1 TaxID=1183427 RepID=A0A1S7QZA1_9HYPH|nr:Acyl carrier protein (ACP) (modular protein) [Agrobacterium deltaense Zutra 3/1]